MLPAATASTPAPIAAAAVREVLNGRQVQPLFQPIVDLGTRAVVAVEALARGPAGTALEFPDRLFAAATDAGLVGQLDLLCCERALECAIAAPVTPPLVFVNAEPGVLNQPLSPRLIELVRGGLPFRQVLEFTERALPAVPGSMLRIASMVQQWGNGLALDDVGVDPMSLAFLPVLEPEVIKLDMSLVRNPDAEHTCAVSAVVRAEAQRTGAVVIAEGIETEADLLTARQLGARWGQGWLFGRPGLLEHARHTYARDAVRQLRPPRPGFHQPDTTPFQIAVRQSTTRLAIDHEVNAVVAQLRDVVAADAAIMVIASVPAGAIPAASGSLPELVGRARSVLVVDTPIPGEFSVAVIGAGHGAAVCGRVGQQPQTVFTEDLATVAEISRAMLSQLL
ncbi:EAL domain-containing protein [Actinoplanes sp. Pm04-4]|uniref:EAL domain-containing protein n=1 Tax=Paractinoplanes pyxinae TaxID=2997416 RepID=A0ABT4BB65_9ACTN|nr:EAL domain-containing protein [Actinoplanes pyxinae]MCY1143764.1 EAL domain-containing protein [Actinoplanes pyxinae]